MKPSVRARIALSQANDHRALLERYLDRSYVCFHRPTRRFLRHEALYQILRRCRRLNACVTPSTPSPPMGGSATGAKNPVSSVGGERPIRDSRGFSLGSRWRDRTVSCRIGEPCRAPDIASRRPLSSLPAARLDEARRQGVT